MKTRYADLHIHTVLSPCGDLEMSPANILRTARQNGLDIIGITDHNSTREAKIIRDAAENTGLFVLAGAEVTTREEVHCLAFFEEDGQLTDFQTYLDTYLPDIPNNPEKFGYQVVADIQDNIIYEEPKLLISAITPGLEEIEKKVHSLQGIFIPAHIDKSHFSILSQLGFIPPSLQCDALELSPHTTYTSFIHNYDYLKNYPFIRSSDAHYLPDIGKVSTPFELDEISFSTIREAIHNSRF